MSRRTPPAPDPTTGVAAVEARMDQALAVIDDALRAGRSPVQLRDALLDVRLTLRPTTPAEAGR